MTEHVMEQPQTEVSAIQPHFSGAILGLQGDVLHGWAMDTTQQEHRPVVEVFIDGASVAVVRADQYEPNAPAGDKFHGFAVQLRQRWLDEARLITAQIANRTFVLEGQLSLPIPPSEDSGGVSSQVWHTDGLRIGGWCWDPKAPNRHVQVTVREGDRVIGLYLCNQHNQTLAYRSTSDHGFTIDLPWEMADGKVHELELVDDRGRSLVGSPIRLCCWPEGVEGLIRQLGLAQDAATLALLNDVAKEQSIRLPKSAGWHSYSKWFDTFQRVDANDVPPLSGRLGVLLISEGDIELEQRTLSSLETGNKPPQNLVCAIPKDLVPALEKLIASGCDRILPIHAGDRVAVFALAHLSALLDEGAAWGYADCDRDGPNQERTLPWLKPVWDIDLFIGADVFTAGAIFSASIVRKALTLLDEATETGSCSWHTLTAAIALATQRNASSVSHIPRVLYHRSHQAPSSPEQAQRCPEREQAIAWLCAHLAPGSKISAVSGYPSLLRAHWPLPNPLPRVSLIIPTRDQYKLLSTCIEGLLTGTDYANLEIIVVDNQSTDPKTLDFLTTLDSQGVRVLRHPYPFNYSTINNRAVDLATGDIVGFINNDIEVINSGWLNEMVAQLLRPGVGAVGAKLLWPNRMVQHGGVVVGINGLAAHSGNTLADQDPGYMALNLLTRRQSAITAACMLTRKSVFDKVAGLDEYRFPVAFNDVDFCLKIQQQGLHLIWTAAAQLIHAESASRGKDLIPSKAARARREQHNFREKWTLDNPVDPYYHPALSHDYISGPYGGLLIPFNNFSRRTTEMIYPARKNESLENSVSAESKSKK